MLILKYSVKPKVPHRVCNTCKEECDGMNKFVEENKIQFDRDTLGLEWLAQFNIDQDLAKQQYKQNINKDTSEYNLFKGQLVQVYDEIEQNQNYSLRDFFNVALGKVDKQNVINALDRVVGTFLLNYPEVGYQADLIFIALFLMCFATEASAYSLLALLYTDVIPHTLYNRALRISHYDFNSEINQISKLCVALRVPAEPMKPFLQLLKHYILPLTLNLFQFETTYFIISNIFAEDGYTELLRCMAAAFSLQDFSSTNDTVQLQLLWNVRVSNLQNQYYTAKKYKAENNQMVRSLSVVQQRESELKVSNESLKNELQQQYKQVNTLKVTVEALQQQVQTHSAQNQLLTEESIKNKQQLQQYQDENTKLVEQNHNIKLQLMQLESSRTNDNSKLENSSKTFEQSQAHIEELNQCMQQITTLQKDKSTLEQELLKSRQEIELLKMEKQNTNPTQMSQLIQLKNQTISKLTQENSNKELKIQQLERDMQQNKAESKGQESFRSASVYQVTSVIKDLEDGRNLVERKNQEILKLKRRIGELEAKTVEPLNVVTENPQDVHVTMQIKAEQELSDDLHLLLQDPDPQKRMAARNVKVQINKLNEELIFQRTQAELRKEQLNPSKQRAESLQKQLDFLVEQNKELQIDVEHKRDQISELDRVNRGKSIQTRTKLRDDKEILRENQQSCTSNKDCELF